MLKDIREILFEQYCEEVEYNEPAAMDAALNEVLSLLDDKLFDIMCDAVTAAINEQMKMAYMAGFGAGASACQMSYAVAV